MNAHLPGDNGERKPFVGFRKSGRSGKNHPPLLTFDVGKSSENEVFEFFLGECGHGMCIEYVPDVAVADVDMDGCVFPFHGLSLQVRGKGRTAVRSA